MEQVHEGRGNELQIRVRNYERETSRNKRVRNKANIIAMLTELLPKD
jgi:hypothetical protein